MHHRFSVSVSSASPVFPRSFPWHLQRACFALYSGMTVKTQALTSERPRLLTCTCDWLFNLKQTCFLWASVCLFLISIMGIMPHMQLSYKIFEALNEIMYVNSLTHCPAHGRCLKNEFSILYVLCINCWVKQKVLLPWQSLFCLGSGFLMNVCLPDVLIHKAHLYFLLHPAPSWSFGTPFSWTKSGEPWEATHEPSL